MDGCFYKPWTLFFSISGLRLFNEEKEFPWYFAHGKSYYVFRIFCVKFTERIFLCIHAKIYTIGAQLRNTVAEDDLWKFAKKLPIYERVFSLHECSLYVA